MVVDPGPMMVVYPSPGWGAPTGLLPVGCAGRDSPIVDSGPGIVVSLPSDGTSAGRSVGCAGVDSPVVAAGGRVRVTVVGVAAHTLQTVTVVVHPSGISVGCTDPGISVPVAVADAVPGQ